ncbi:succinate-semialdehyde dehydrogenase, mitochondrial-like [Oncorhynchus mykiss]|uniref:succinate-semialdehyde dehydrogenase, mitochondrial-like n=1 Tax=Oncorhynchus mykiss TaxID=8022 RepID=UPI001877522C|nr:succinate-semialdehyde dehydrogenase, mitochondrial-like [Oncorhynchus mykiss]
MAMGKTDDTCVCSNRFLVQSRFHDHFIEKLGKAMDAELRLGHGSDPNTTQGPLINVRASEKVEHQVMDAVSRGAKVLRGGGGGSVWMARSISPLCWLMSPQTCCVPERKPSVLSSLSSGLTQGRKHLPLPMHLMWV